MLILKLENGRKQEAGVVSLKATRKEVYLSSK